ncbi:MAG: flagellar filament capping protein FliD [Selenomonadaceae bacterium]|nr:flagellar filament capping protein FliD [Selenomonadaceae bacterium]
MSTINSMLSGAQSLFNSYYSNSNNSKSQDSISKLWNAYGSYESNANSALSGLSMISSNVSSLVKSYDDTKNTFYDEFDETISALKKSAENIKGYNFNVGEDALKTSENVNEDGEKVTTTTKSAALTDALKAVEEFASNYNDTIDFFKNNSDVSKRVSRMAQTFADTTYRRANYQSIGLQIDSDGKMKIDEDKLAKAITEDPDKVSSILGKDGLAGKAEDHISLASSQRDRLFPSAQTLIGKDLTSAAIYTGTSYRNMSNYANVGNLINMMF